MEELEHGRNKEYEINGVSVFLHFLKNYEPHSLLMMRVGLYHGGTLLRDNKGNACSWNSRVMHPEEAIFSNQESMEKLKKLGVYIYSETTHGNRDVVIPVNDNTEWIRDFYTMLWDTDLKKDLVLHIELMVKENPYAGGTFRTLSVADP